MKKLIPFLIGWMLVAAANAKASGEEVAAIWRRFEISIDKRALDTAITTRDPSQWRPLMGQARHFNFPREKGIALLSAYLDHPDAHVRAAAASYLFELGSTSGGQVLLGLLKDAVAGKKNEVDLAGVAGILQQYHYPFDPALVYAAYRESRNSLLLMYAQLLDCPAAKIDTQARLKSLGVLDGALTMAGIMRLDDPQSIAIYQANFASTDAVRREHAAAALYRVTGDRKYLDYVVAVAEAAVGLRSNSPIPSDGGSEAFNLFEQTLVPEATNALERIEAAARQSGRSVEASRALIGLYFFHRDYGYVDKLILAQFTNTLPAGLRIGSIWELAAARRTPEIEAAAKAYNNEAYEREFIRKEGRPAESWVFKYISSTIPSRAWPSRK